MKHVVMLVGLMTIATSISAQTLRGRIMNEKGEPIVYANVVLEQKVDSSFITGTVTLEDGSFMLNYTGQNAFRLQDNFLKVSSIGYKTICYSPASADVGILRLKADTTSLEGVVVEGNRPIYRMSTGGFITDVATSVLSKAGTAEDVLKRIPSIVKKKDGFEVFGKGTPLIYINGRKVQDQSELDNLKSEDIKDVELIRNPGAAYDAEIGAVIRIRTKRITGEGFGFDVRSSYYRSTDTDWIQQVNMNYRHNRWDFFGTFKFNHSEDFSNEPITQLTQTTDTLWRQQNNGHGDYRSETYTAITGFNYIFNDKNSIGARYTATFKPYDIKYGTYDNTVSTTPSLPDREYYDRSLTTIRQSQDNKPTHLVNVYYNGKVGKTSIDFNTDYMQSQYSIRMVSQEKSQNLDSREVVSDNNVKNRLIASKLILTYPLLGGDFSLGGEYTYTDRTDRYLSKSEQYVPSSASRLKERHISPFFEYQRMTPIGQLTAGLRYERVQFDYYDEGIWQSDGSRKYGDMFPSLSWGTRFGKVLVQLNYTTGTSRPTYSQLSNNVFYANRFTMQKGNPLLKPSYTHTVALNALWGFLNFSTSFSSKNNVIIWTAEQEVPESPITYVSYRNQKNIKAISASITASPKIAFWTPQLYLEIRKQWFNVQSIDKVWKLDKPLFLTTFNNACTLPANFIVNVDFTYIGKGHTENVYLYKSRSQMDVSLVKTFFNDKLSIKLEGTDLFHKMKDSNRLYDRQTILWNSNTYDTREVSLTIRYKFNTGKSHYKGTGAGNNEKSRL